jgi:ketosteroid isomerase-like protein
VTERAPLVRSGFYWARDNNCHVWSRDPSALAKRKRPATERAVPLLPRDTGRAMSQESVEVVRRAFEYEVFGRGDASASFDPEVVMTPVEEAPRHGLDAIRDNFMSWEAAWDELETTAEEFIDGGDRVVVTIYFRGRGRRSGIEIDTRLYEVYFLREGKIVRVQEFTDRAEAFEAAGLSE